MPTLAILYIWATTGMARADCGCRSVTEYTSKAQWQSEVSVFDTITFIGFPPNTAITTQYHGWGALFTDGFDLIHYNNSFVNDGVGLYGAMNSITIDFLSPMHAIAVDYPGVVYVRLFRGEEAIHVSQWFGCPYPGTGCFAGLVSADMFDRAIIADPLGGGVYIDDLFFGPPIPAPPALGVLAVAAIASRRRRLIVDHRKQHANGLYFQPERVSSEIVPPPARTFPRQPWHRRLTRADRRHTVARKRQDQVLPYVLIADGSSLIASASAQFTTPSAAAAIAVDA